MGLDFRRRTGAADGQGVAADAAEPGGGASPGPRAGASHRWNSRSAQACGTVVHVGGNAR